ncbi:unnamed protein product [Notodromas monacha]|uniref:Uncharacterized protein n=1 Tax=Notodromas monacha TaxID=399045 RepID=A0A7R9BG12_9CRUS|nr:unnamed protein product [Notodromas monacha]CAG0913944.1 unnamed protein product [Notodromas monacha]
MPDHGVVVEVEFNKVLDFDGGNHERVMPLLSERSEFIAMKADIEEATKDFDEYEKLLALFSTSSNDQIPRDDLEKKLSALSNTLNFLKNSGAVERFIEKFKSVTSRPFLSANPSLLHADPLSLWQLGTIGSKPRVQVVEQALKDVCPTAGYQIKTVEKELEDLEKELRDIERCRTGK